MYVLLYMHSMYNVHIGNYICEKYFTKTGLKCKTDISICESSPRTSEYMDRTLKLQDTYVVGGT